MPAKFYLSSCKLFSLLYLTSALSIPVGIGEFLEGWLGLVNRLANTKYLFESTHTLPTTSFVPGHEPFNAAEFMVYVHKVCILVQFYIPGGGLNRIIRAESIEVNRSLSSNDWNQSSRNRIYIFFLTGFDLLRLPLESLD